MFIYVSVGVCYIENIVSFRRGGDHEHHHQCGDYCSCGHASVSGYGHTHRVCRRTMDLEDNLQKGSDARIPVVSADRQCGWVSAVEVV